LNDFHDFSGGGGEKKTPTEAKKKSGKRKTRRNEGHKGNYADKKTSG
jgi:hypothetical protein